MTRYGADYRVSRPTGVCAATSKPLEPGSVCFATLCERAEDDGFDRLDFSPEAWEGGARPDRLFSYWRTTVPDPTDRPNAMVEDVVLEDLFEQLAGDDRRTRVAYRFILALILMRKRRLKYVGRRGRGPDEHWLLKPRGSEPDAEPIEVVNPQLQDDDIRELADQLSEVLRGEL